MTELDESHALVAQSGEASLLQLAHEFDRSVERIEQFMLSQEQVGCPVIHRYGPGIYIREVNIPAGTMAVGHHQNFEHMNVMLKGRVTMLNDDGSTTELAAPALFVGKPGRKVGYIHEDVVWLNVYSTTEQDVAKLESTFITKSEQFGQHYADKVSRLQNEVDQSDYRKAIEQFGFTEEQARAQSENTDDMMELPGGGYKVKVGPSRIEGQGLFATADIQLGESIAPARLFGKRTIAGRYTNHSASPNAQMVRAGGGDIYLVATKQINGCRGGQDGEEITIDYRQALALTLEIGLEK